MGPVPAVDLTTVASVQLLQIRAFYRPPRSSHAVNPEMLFGAPQAEGCDAAVFAPVQVFFPIPHVASHGIDRLFSAR